MAMATQSMKSTSYMGQQTYYYGNGLGIIGDRAKYQSEYADQHCNIQDSINLRPLPTYSEFDGQIQKAGEATDNSSVKIKKPKKSKNKQEDSCCPS